MTKTLSQRCPVWRTWGQFAYIFNLQTEIEMEEFYDSIIMTPTVIWENFERIFCVLCFLVSSFRVKPIWTCPLQVDDRSGNSWAVGGICCGKTRVNGHDIKIHGIWSCFHLDMHSHLYLKCGDFGSTFCSTLLPGPGVLGDWLVRTDFLRWWSW